MNLGLGDLLNDIAGSSAELSTPSVVMVAAVMGALIIFGPTWKVLRSVVTIAHEGGHALAALVTGRKLQSITLHSDTSGLTVSRGKPRGFGMILTASAGYTGPAVLGVIGAFVVSHGFGYAWTWAFIALLIVMLVKIRNLFGAWSLVATGGVLAVCNWFGTPTIRAVVAHALVWLFLFGALKAVVELSISRRRQQATRVRGKGTTDADVLGSLSWFPAPLWTGFFGVVALLCLGLAIYLLLPQTAGLRDLIASLAG